MSVKKPKTLSDYKNLVAKGYALSLEEQRDLIRMYEAMLTARRR